MCISGFLNQLNDVCEFQVVISVITADNSIMAEGGMGHRVASIMEVIDVTDVTEDTTANMDTGTSTEGLKKMKWFFFCNCFTQHLLLLHVLLVSRLCYMQFQLNSFLRLIYPHAHLFCCVYVISLAITNPEHWSEVIQYSVLGYQ